MAKTKGRSHEPNRAFRMSFPILKHLASTTEPVTAYGLEKTKLDTIHSGKTKKAWIDKPTIYRSLRLLEDNREADVTDRKVCRGGRVRKKYVITRRGVRDLLWGHHLGYVDISKPFVRKLAENHHDLFPRIFGLWPEFIREQAEDIAWSKLVEASDALADQFEGMFLALVIADLELPTNPDHDLWLQVASRNQRIGEALVAWTLRGVSGNIEHVDRMLQLLSPWPSTFLQETDPTNRLRDSLIRFLERLPRSTEDKEAPTSEQRDPVLPSGQA